jgi:NAD-dependent DNA ligase
MSIEYCLQDLIKDTIDTLFLNIKDNSINLLYIRVIMGDSYAIDYTFLQNNYISFCKNTSLSKIKDVLDYLDHFYYNTNAPLVSDNVYDYIADYYFKSIGKSKDKIGAPISGNSKVKLPVHMGSMDKVKLGSTELTTFLKKYKNNKCVSEKLDGVSLLIDYDGPGIHAYTRGDGSYGQNVSKLLDFIKVGVCNNGYVRGELIITKDNWEKIKNNWKNARNYVSGIVNKKKLEKKDFQYVDFVAYEYINPAHTMCISNQLNFLKNAGFNVAKHRVVKIQKDDELLNILVEFKDQSKYEIDGIIIQDDIFHTRNESGNPKYAKAFKSESENERAEAEVVSVEWTASKDGRLKPVVVIQPVELNGVTITRATGYNGNFISSYGIGPGAKIEIIRSGDVIPKIVTVLNSVEPSMPNVEYEWDNNHTDVVLINPENDKVVIVKQMEHFINTIGIEHFKAATLAKAYDVGIKSIYDIVMISKSDLLKINGIKDKSAEKILNSIQTKLEGVDIVTLTAGVPYFAGLGVKRIKLIYQNIPDFLVQSEKNLYKLILSIDGFSDKLADIFISGFKEFKTFVEFFEKKFHINKGSVATQNMDVNGNNDNQNQHITGKVFVFSGFRNKELKDTLISKGAEVSESLTKKTNYLVVKDSAANTSKTEKAIQLNVNIITPDQLQSIL